jgi:hypothetical protein
MKINFRFNEKTVRAIKAIFINGNGQNPRGVNPETIPVGSSINVNTREWTFTGRLLEKFNYRKSTSDKHKADIHLIIGIEYFSGDLNHFLNFFDVTAIPNSILANYDSPSTKEERERIYKQEIKNNKDREEFDSQVREDLVKEGAFGEDFFREAKNAFQDAFKKDGGESD